MQVRRYCCPLSPSLPLHRYKQNIGTGRFYAKKKKEEEKQARFTCSQKQTYVLNEFPKMASLKILSTCSRGRNKPAKGFLLCKML